MLDIASLIKTKLETDWTEDDPAFADIAWVYDEFNPNDPKLQVLLEISPAKSNFITRDIYRIEHLCKITIYVRPTNYMPDTIATFKTTFLNVKTEIDRILSPRFGVTGIYSVEKQGWRDIEMAVGRDIKSTKEPIVFTAQQEIKTIYYEGDLA